MRILAINDISCVGRCSLTVALPILNACGLTCDVLPTALLSSHTGGFEGYTFLDLSDGIPAMLQQWKALGLQYDVIYSGYLGNAKQLDMVKRIKADFLKSDGIMIVDPVLGDNGKLYTNFNTEFVEGMKSLCKEATYILPNYTEACLLTDNELHAKSDSLLLSELLLLCPGAVITGVEHDELSMVYSADGGYGTKKTDGFFCGSGDVFASAFTSCIANGLSAQEAIEKSARFTSSAVARTAAECPDRRFGLQFEPDLAAFALSLKNDLVNKVEQAVFAYLGGDGMRIQHLIKVMHYAALIADGESLTTDEKRTLRLACALHDIGIHESERKYGNANGKNQEKEGPAVARELLRPFALSEAETEQICKMISLHHSYSKIGEDKLLRILVEADMLVNGYEEEIPKESVALFKKNVFRTNTGKKLLETIYQI